MTNEGVITADGGGGAAWGVQAGGNSIVTNKGRITTTGTGAAAVQADANVTFTNTGAASASGTNAVGFYAGGNAILNNSGSLSGTAYGVVGVNQVSATNATTISGGLAGVYAGQTMNPHQFRHDQRPQSRRIRRGRQRRQLGRSGRLRRRIGRH